MPRKMASNLLRPVIESCYSLRMKPLKPIDFCLFFCRRTTGTLGDAMHYANSFETIEHRRFVRVEHEKGNVHVSGDLADSLDLVGPPRECVAVVAAFCFRFFVFLLLLFVAIKYRLFVMIRLARVVLTPFSVGHLPCIIFLSSVSRRCKRSCLQFSVSVSKRLLLEWRQ